MIILILGLCLINSADRIVEEQWQRQDHNPSETSTGYVPGRNIYGLLRKISPSDGEEVNGPFELHNDLQTVHKAKPTGSATSSRMYLVGISNTVLSGIEDGKFVRLCISIHYSLQVFFIFFAAFITGTHKWLATSSDGCLTFWMNPWQHLVFVNNNNE